MAKEVPERGSPETTTIGLPNRRRRYRRCREVPMNVLLGSGPLPVFVKTSGSVELIAAIP
jgi:hypothetical protein